MRGRMVYVLKIFGLILIGLAVLGGLFILLCEWPVYQQI